MRLTSPAFLLSLSAGLAISAFASPPTREPHEVQDDPPAVLLAPLPTSIPNTITSGSAGVFAA